ncbi:MAG TPA: glycoside hydrolase family 3 C-terminal domain-containing protein [Chitinophagales bacterium]|nr:glycoside hydrolase family 3 C-terminal domain-containing protein [Chitinophagales bacterium]
MTDAQAETKARELIAQMSLKEKVYEMHGHGVVRFGLSILFSKKIKPVKAGGNKRLGIPSTIFLDGPRGVSLTKGTTAFPVTMARGASWDTELEERVGQAMAKEIRALKANYSGAVCMNLLRHPAWGRAQETYGEDPLHVGIMASALVKGIQSQNVQACAKHFAANSMENNRFGGSMNMSERTLHEVYLPHFKRVIQSGAASVMSAYNKLNGVYCGHSKYLLTDILRKDWGFKGYITSDWQNGLYDAKAGIEAGMNIEMPAPANYNLKKIKQLIKDGEIKEQQIDDLIFPIIRTKLLFASKKDLQEYPKSLAGSKEHTDLAREVAQKSAVLLKNDSNLLPLKKDNIKRIAVIGSLADVKETGDHGSSRCFPKYIVTPLEAMRTCMNPALCFWQPEVLTAPANDLAAIKAVCEKADVVLVVAGTTYLDEGEYIGNGTIRDRNNPDKKNFITRTGILGVGGDREYLHLHQQDIDIIHTASAANKKVIVSLVAGSAITVEEWHNEVPAIIQTFYNGMEGGNALAAILFGDVNPSGKLPFTVPKLESDLPQFNSFEANAEYGYYHGYTLFDKEHKEPRYPFGYGLSYTQFTISDLNVSIADVATEFPSLEKKTKELTEFYIVTVKVKNTGDRSGAEVVQVYVSPPKGKVDVPEKLLRAFQKVYLQPGEEKTVELTIPVKDLAYYDEATKSWIVEKGKYEVLVGNSSRDERMLKAVVVVK